MNKGLKTGLIIGAVVVVLVMLFAGSYNGLIYIFYHLAENEHDYINYPK